MSPDSPKKKPRQNHSRQRQLITIHLACGCLPLAVLQISNANPGGQSLRKASETAEAALAMATSERVAAERDTVRNAVADNAHSVQVGLQILATAFYTSGDAPLCRVITRANSAQNIRAPRPTRRALTRNG
jgi:hypothetical protein